MRTGAYTRLTDEALVLHALVGSLPAFDELVRRFRPAVLLTATQTLGTRCGAEDVAQEAFLLAFKALPQLADPGKFPGWLRAITVHRARRVSAQDGRCVPTDPLALDRLLLAQSAEIGRHPAEQWLRESERDDLRRLLAQLPPEYSSVVQLAYLDKWPASRIAAFLSLPLTTVKWRLHQGRALLRRRLTQLEENSHE